MFRNRGEIDRALQAVAARLELTNAPPVELSACGGAALIVQGLMTRSAGTKDVDAFAFVSRDAGGGLSLSSCAEIPAYLAEAIRVVAAEQNLPANWLNSGPTSVLNYGLPEGLEARLHPVRYGSSLTVYYLDRLDQIHFKLQAAADRGPDSKHVEDLRALEPTSAEMEAAARWAKTTEAPTSAFHSELLKCVRFLGFDDVAERLQGPI
ncbi:MAG: hypothetical protein HZA54_09185 [Planctomycetes bacterium]|nr:hypothetical protein [Planctomycetota bacterium]